MGELGNVVFSKGVADLITEVEDQNENKSQRDHAASDVGNRTEKNQHEDDPAGSENAGRKEDGVEQTSDKSGDEAHDQKWDTSVFFFENRTDEENDGKVHKQVSPVGVTRYMEEEPEK